LWLQRNQEWSIIVHRSSTGLISELEYKSSSRRSNPHLNFDAEGEGAVSLSFGGSALCIEVTNPIILAVFKAATTRSGVTLSSTGLNIADWSKSSNRSPARNITSNVGVREGTCWFFHAEGIVSEGGSGGSALSIEVTFPCCRAVFKAVTTKSVGTFFGTGLNIADWRKTSYRSVARNITSLVRVREGTCWFWQNGKQGCVRQTTWGVIHILHNKDGDGGGLIK